ncbi:DNA cytosine methyltransferase [Corallococcus sp. CA054B]|uniref:DNA cytosine methyltransferase n=1 Tax=Corallococcus sp. CA054B TaxID=2316734 RepID=UPI000EA38731|nr:DNA cytosine methyltransferase [Corallococcus sp. CA054B]RKG62853.1 DNA cytosine methyltransferase [Corallococcus sp. CA054B]
MGKPKVISLFSGAGGMDYGFEAAGFDTAVTLEFDHDCCETLRASRPDWSVIERSVFDVPTPELLEVGGLKRGEADLLIGGPPCQPFSKSGYWARGDARRLDDPRADTLAAYMRLVEEALPRVFVLENVTGLAFSGKDEGLQLLLEKIERINAATKSNYKPHFQVLNAAAYGVPQMRERFVLVASRDGATFRFPAPTHVEPSSEGDLPMVGLPQYRTAWEAIGDLKPSADEDLAVRGKWAGLLPSIPEGQNYLFHTDRGGGLPLFGWRRRYWTFLLKLAKNRPSWTIQAQPGPSVGPFHWENRRLSLRELARIQTFPDDVQVQGSRTSAQRQLGNAVPSLLAEVLGRAIRTQLLGLGSVRGSLKLLPAERRPIPPAEPVHPVPRPFRKLMGDHEAHPGTGKGYGATARTKSASELGNSEIPNAR